MTWFFSSGHAADLVIAVIAGELMWLLIVRRRDTKDVMLSLAPGAMMLLALRAALTGMAWYWIALALAVSLPLHLADLRHRRLI